MQYMSDNGLTISLRAPVMINKSCVGMIAYSGATSAEPSVMIGVGTSFRPRGAPNSSRIRALWVAMPGADASQEYLLAALKTRGSLSKSNGNG